MIKLFQILIFMCIQLPLLPISIVGYLFIIVKTMVYAKNYGISATSTSMIGTRWMLHWFRSREDESTVQLVSVLPFMSESAFWLTIGPAYIAYRISGFVPTTARLIQPEDASIKTITNSRTPLFDKIMEKHLAAMEQVVIMGAGFDTRAFKFCKGKNLRVFELDKKNTQNCKVEALKNAQIGVSDDWISFVAVDFEKESWVEKLIENGFELGKKTFFLWEGVTLYLEEETVKRTLKAMATVSGEGSVIAFDIYSEKLINFFDSALLKYFGQKMLNMSGEPFVYGVDTSKDSKVIIEKLLNEAGLQLNELVLLGKNNATEKPFSGVVEAQVR